MLTDVLPQSIQTKQEIPAENAREILETSVLNTSENLFCRTCLSTQNLRPLFCNSDYNDMTHKLKLVTGLEIEKCDGLSQKICEECLEAIGFCMKFRLKSKHAEETLISLINVHEIKKESNQNKLSNELSIGKVDVVKIEYNKGPSPQRKVGDEKLRISPSGKLRENPKSSCEQESADDDCDDKHYDNIHTDNEQESDSKEDLKPLSRLLKTKVEKLTTEYASTPQITIKKVPIDTYKEIPSTVKLKKKTSNSKISKGKKVKDKNSREQKRLASKNKISTFIRVQNLPPDWEKFVTSKSETLVKKRAVKRDKKAFIKDETPTLIKVENLPEDVDKIPRVKVPRPHRQYQLPPGPPYKCSACDKQFTKRPLYLAHVRFHTHYHVCELCGKICQNPYSLRQHQRARHGLHKTHKCTRCDCDYSAATRTALTVHERRHAGERPFVCDHCGAAFFTRRTLAQHVGVHMPANIQCPMCPKKLRSMRLLSNHKSRKHAKKYSYRCPVCPKVFNDNNCVHKHLSGYHGMPRPEHPVIEKQLVL